MKRLDIYGMSRVGMDGDYEIYVNTDDGGNIPHFHYRYHNDWNKFHTCICIESAEYFSHTGKEDRLNSKQRKSLNKFMNNRVSISKYSDIFDNNWQLVCFLWDINNSNINISDNCSMPNYEDLV